MKTSLNILVIAALLVAGASCAPSRMTAQEGSVSFQLFYDELSPYGTWVEYQNYGYVWMPNVDQGFMPYGTDGHWIYTDLGWTWVSDYPWGWAPFHYGRWSYDDLYGWFWVPETEWGPAWVTWRRSEGYYGWTPMAPGISIELSFGSGYRVPEDRWIFVRDRDVYRPDIGRYSVDRSQNVTIINTSTVINNTYIDNSRRTTYVAGPPREEVERVAATTVTPVAVRENNTPGQRLAGNQLEIYRPRVQPKTADHQVAPSKVEALKDVKPVRERPHGAERRNDTPPGKSDQPVTVPPPATAPEKVQPSPVSPPTQQNPTRQEPVQPPASNPAEPKGRDVTPPNPNPEKAKGTDAPPPNLSPPERNGRDVPPPTEPPKGKDVTPQDRRPDQPRGKVASPPNMNPLERKGTPNSPPAVSPPDRKGNGQIAPPRQRTAAPPAVRKAPSKQVTPPDTRRRGREPASPPSTKQKGDSLKTSGGGADRTPAD